jgi:hypothetical protein
LNLLMLSVIECYVLSVIILGVKMLCVVILTVISLGGVILSAITLVGIILSAVCLSGNMLSVNRTSRIRHQCKKTTVLSCYRWLINTSIENLNNV